MVPSRVKISVSALRHQVVEAHQSPTVSGFDDKSGEVAGPMCHETDVGAEVFTKYICQ